MPGLPVETCVRLGPGIQQLSERQILDVPGFAASSWFNIHKRRRRYYPLEGAHEG